jgi:putative membrane protein
MPQVITENYTPEMGVDSSQSLAVQRTFLAHERTLMAWVRTSASLISFGFTIYKFFAYLVETEGRILPQTGLRPRQFAIAMIGIGVLALAVAVVQERKALKVLQEQNKVDYSSLAEKVAAILALVGLSLFIAVLLRL